MTTLTNVPLDVIRHEILPNLPVETLLGLCQSSVQYRILCSEPRTWNLLLKRDYGIETDRNSRDLYRMLYRLNIKSNLPQEVITAIAEGPNLNPIFDQFRIRGTALSVSYYFREKSIVATIHLRYRDTDQIQLAYENSNLELVSVTFEGLNVYLMFRSYPSVVNAIIDVLSRLEQLTSLSQKEVQETFAATSTLRPYRVHHARFLLIISGPDFRDEWSQL